MIHGTIRNDDSVAQRSVAMLDQCCDHSKQCRDNVATLCCAKNRRCESSLVTCNVTFKLPINKIRRPRRRSPICLITRRTITDRIGRQEVLLPINHNFNKIFDIQGSFFKSKQQKFQDFALLAVKKKPFKRARDGAYCPISILRHDYLTVLLRLTMTVRCLLAIQNVYI